MTTSSSISTVAFETHTILVQQFVFSISQISCADDALIFAPPCCTRIFTSSCVSCTPRSRTRRQTRRAARRPVLCCCCACVYVSPHAIAGPPLAMWTNKNEFCAGDLSACAHAHTQNVCDVYTHTFLSAIGLTGCCGSPWCGGIWIHAKLVIYSM